VRGEVVKTMQLFNKKQFEDRRRDLRKQQTEAEKIFWNIIRGRKLNNLKFHRQFGIGSYIIDFYCPEIRLAIELDGGQHAENIEYDLVRTFFLNQMNIKVVRFWNNDITNNASGVYDEIVKIVEDIKTSPPTPLLN
jgi:very-short-patch-repair endonuclease